MYKRQVSSRARALISPSPEWTDRLVYDVALALEGGLPDLAPVVARHGLDPSEFVLLLDDPVFLKAVLALREEIAAKGVVFQTRARSLAEDVLRTTHRLSKDPDVSPTVRHDCAKSIVRWAGYDKPDPETALGTGGVTISINIGGDDNRRLSLNKHGQGGVVVPETTDRETPLKPIRFTPDASL